jgi:hypothetical protein
LGREDSENLIPDSDGLVAIMEDQKRERSDTVSTTLSDKPVSKKPGYKIIPEPVLSKYFCNS